MIQVDRATDLFLTRSEHSKVTIIIHIKTYKITKPLHNDKIGANENPPGNKLRGHLRPKTQWEKETQGNIYINNI
jgi:hypothetical protein